METLPFCRRRVAVTWSCLSLLAWDSLEGHFIRFISNYLPSIEWKSRCTLRGECGARSTFFHYYCYYCISNQDRWHYCQFLHWVVIDRQDWWPRQSPGICRSPSWWSSTWCSFRRLRFAGSSRTCLPRSGHLSPAQLLHRLLSAKMHLLQVDLQSWRHQRAQEIGHDFNLPWCLLVALAIVSY